MTRVARFMVVGLAALLSCLPVQADEHGLDARARAAIEVSWLEGNLERVGESESKVVSAQDLLCVAIRDLYWRPDATRGATVSARYRQLPRPAPDSLLGRRFAWLLTDGPTTPWPVATGDEVDPWPVLSLLIQDRQLREEEGYVGDAARNPIRTFLQRAPQGSEADADPRIGWLSYSADEFDRIHADLPPTAEEADAKAEAAGYRMRNTFLGVGGLLALILLTLGYGRRIKPDA